MKKYFLNEKGLSLVEVLAALVILGIVFIGFMMIFPQMTTFNKKTETKLETMNLARQEMAYIQSIPFESNSPLKTSDIQAKYKPDSDSDDEGTFIKIIFGENDYDYVVEFTKAPVPSSDGQPQNIALHQVHLKVLDDGGKVNSETYGYIEVIEPTEPTP